MHAKEVDINKCDGDGLTALRATAMKGNVYLMDLLILNGADVEECNNKDGNTALHYAATWGQDKAVKLLLDNCADVHAINEDNGNVHTYLYRKLMDIIFCLAY